MNTDSRSTPRRLVAVVVASLALVVSIDSGIRALAQSIQTAWIAHGAWGESFAQAEERLFGADYMRSIRAVRERIPATGTVFFVDDQPTPQGADYAALHFLAPRRLVRLGSSSNLDRSRLSLLSRRTDWIVRVPATGKPLELLSAASLLPEESNGRESRP
jgi:hypothetical protein